jgi:tetratricopeptide (TPR) repeat protein
VATPDFSGIVACLWVDRNRFGLGRIGLKPSFRMHPECQDSPEQQQAIKPGCAEALYNRGNALRDLNRTAAALASFDKALAIKPDLAEALNNRASRPE